MLKKGLKFLSISTILLLAACNQQPEFDNKELHSIEFTKVASKNNYDQTPSKHAMELISKKEEVTEVRSVNNDKELFFAFKVETLDNWNLEKLEKDVTKQLEKRFKNLKVNVSTDKKVFMELEKLQFKMLNEDADRKKINNDLKRLNHLKNDE